MQALTEGREKVPGPGIISPVPGSDSLPVKIELGSKTRGAHPAPADRWIHQFNESPETAPHDHEVRDAAGQHHDGDGGQRTGFIDQYVIGRQHDLLSPQPQLIRDLFDGVDGGAIHAGLAGLAQAAVVYRNAETLQQRLESCWPTVHVGGLDHLRDKELLHRLPRVRVWSAMAAGDTRAVSMSAEVGIGDR